MTGFGEHFKNERREKTLALIKNFFGALFSKKAWFFIAFWGFLFLTLYSLYKTLTFENKFPVECGKIENFEILSDGNGRPEHHIFIATPKGIEDLEVIESVYNKYEKLYKTDNNVKYCQSYIDKSFVFYWIVTGILAIITIVFLVSYSSEY